MAEADLPLLAPCALNFAEAAAALAGMVSLTEKLPDGSAVNVAKVVLVPESLKLSLMVSPAQKPLPVSWTVLPAGPDVGSAVRVARGCQSGCAPPKGDEITWRLPPPGGCTSASADTALRIPNA